MENATPTSPGAQSSISVSDLSKWIEKWFNRCHVRQFSDQAIANHRIVLEKLLWYLDDRKLHECGEDELMGFLAYVTNGHNDARGRWGNPRLREKASPGTVQTYYSRLHTFFAYIVEKGVIAANPMDGVTTQINRNEQIDPLSLDQIDRLLAIAKKSRHPRRDTAILLFLLDTGVRATELCNIRIRDIDLSENTCEILGKGNKPRLISFGDSTKRAIFQYLKEDSRDTEDVLFASDRGERAGGALTRSGLRQLVQRLGRAANIKATRCSPHTFRHTFAIQWLREGGTQIALMKMLGHSDAKMTQRYVKLSDADVATQHVLYSPVDRMRDRNR